MAVSMVRSRWHWDSHETFSSCLLSATSSKYLPTYAVSHPGFVVVTKGVWHLSVGLGHGLAMGDSRRHPPTGTHGRSGQGRGQKSHPFPTISPGTTRSDLATELKPWMLETDKISLYRNKLKDPCSSLAEPGPAVPQRPLSRALQTVPGSPWHPPHHEAAPAPQRQGRSPPGAGGGLGASTDRPEPGTAGAPGGAGPGRAAASPPGRASAAPGRHELASRLEGCY